MYCKEKWRTAGGKDPLFGHVDGFRIGPKYSGEENSFVKEYIAQLKSESVSVGVITNHNKFDEGEYKALKKSGRKEGILILPGVELSVKEANGIHTLIAMPGAHWRCMNCRLQSLVSVLESQAMRKLWYRPEWKL